MHRGSGDYSGKRDKHEKHGSSRYDRSKGKEPASNYPSSSRRPQEASLSFLFLVNELYFNESIRDQYHNRLPPIDPRQYTYEIKSKVMRYKNGNVEEAFDYTWVAREGRRERELWWDRAVEEDGSRSIDPSTGDYWHPEEYSKAAIFACNPHLPFVVARADPMITPTSSQWEFLHLYHPRGHLEGITQVAIEDSDLGRSLGLEPGPGLCRHTAGARPSWIPGLLPSTYRRQRDSPPSRGLGGDLPIILGLMAFSEGPDPTNTNSHTNAIFLTARRWRRNRWMHENPPRGYPDQIRDPEPRGFLVLVFFDPENPQGSTRENLLSFEWNEAIVRE
ncbi:Fc.00g046940.m01.CDS01 [Cosmosporella sp. VM-42]